MRILRQPSPRSFPLSNAAGDGFKKGFTTTANNRPVKVGEGMEDLD